MKSGDDLSSRSVSRQVLSARESLTSVFGMGTGGSFLPLSPLWLYIRLSPHTYKFLCVSFSFLPFPDSVRFGPPDFVSETLSSSFPKTYNYTAISLSKKLSFHLSARKNYRIFVKRFCEKLSSLSRSSPRPISIGQLNTLRHLHLRPINLVVFKGSYYLTIWDILS